MRENGVERRGAKGEATRGDRSVRVGVARFTIGDGGLRVAGDNRGEERDGSRWSAGDGSGTGRNRHGLARVALGQSRMGCGWSDRFDVREVAGAGNG